VLKVLKVLILVLLDNKDHKVLKEHKVQIRVLRDYKVLKE
jgi:hypothetical protein